MDPTKSFDHLDPKLKETYARVMGTNTGSVGSATPNPTDPATPITFDPAQPADDPSQLGGSLNQASAQPNPGTGPTISTLPTDSASILSTPDAASPESTTDPSAPSTSSFFSNPSPATSNPMQAVNGNNMASPLPEPAATAPVTPYMPADSANGVQYAQPLPLPSPSSVNQASQHETSPLLKVLYIVGAVIFFAIYTVFWIKVFNLPFLF